jgi:hypothetical protein
MTDHARRPWSRRPSGSDGSAPLQGAPLRPLEYRTQTDNVTMEIRVQIKPRVWLATCPIIPSGRPIKRALKVRVERSNSS